VVLDGARADEQLGRDVSIRVSVCRKPRDLTLLWRELVECLDGPFAGVLTGRQSSRSARRANASAMLVNASSAVRSCSGRRGGDVRGAALTVERWVRASSVASGYRWRCATDSRYRLSATSPSLSSARDAPRSRSPTRS